jgi:hypothetical protein
MDCSVYSEWQAVVAIGSLETLRAEIPSMPPFRIVRLVSCNSDADFAVSARTRHYGDESRVSMSIGDPYPYAPMKGFVYPPLNKPYAIQDWLFNSTSGRALHDNDELIIVDTDSIFLLPPSFGVSKLGRPAASNKYYMGGEWLTGAKSEVRRFCGAACENLNTAHVAEFYDMGAPYYMRAADLRRMVGHWYRMTNEMVLAADINRAWSTPGGWICEMYAYSMAAIIEKLPHRGLADQMAHVADHLVHLPPSAATHGPVSLHFCQNYNITPHDQRYQVAFGKHDWHQQSLLDCRAADEFAFMRRHPYNPPPEFESNTPPTLREALQSAPYGTELWMLWHIRHHIGKQLRRWRSKHCANGIQIDSSL